MAKAKTKSKTAWRKCEGVNSRTGRVKKGYKVAKGGRCPTKAAAKTKAKTKSRSRAKKAPTLTPWFSAWGPRPK